MPRLHVTSFAARFVLLACALVAIATFGTSSASADFEITSFEAKTTNADGTLDTQAGAHPYAATTSFTFKTVETAPGKIFADQNVKNIVVDLPTGFSGNATAVPTCRSASLAVLQCPAGSQVGIITNTTDPLGLQGIPQTTGVYNMARPADQPAIFGFQVLGVPVYIAASVRSDGDYGVRTTIANVPEGEPVTASSLTLWGVPGDPSHDAQRGSAFECSGDPTNPENCGGGGASSGAVTKPFLTNPTLCAEPLETKMSAYSWQEPGAVRTARATSPPVTGCERLSFEPTFKLVPETTQADAPSGDRALELKVPQNENPAGRASPQLREAVVAAPLGITLNPGAADGLQGCGDEQFALHAGTSETCPNASVIGTVKVVTPLLEAPLEGQVFLGAPECSPCSQADALTGRMLRLFLQAQGSGVMLKVAGTAVADPVSGQVTVTFKELPRQPFSDLQLTFNGGSRAVFINPLNCGLATLNGTLSPWSGTGAVGTSSSFTVDWDGAGGACPSTLPFSPSFSGGTVNPQAGTFSTFTTTFSRPDRNQVLNAVSVRTPVGLLGMLATVPLCSEPQAAQGSCAAASRIGTASVAAGTGSHPLWLSGPVYLTAGYKGAPFGLSIAVPAVAGPFNLGTVVTRAAINIDPRTAQITITSDPFPQIIDGIKTHIQTVNVTVDRQGFMFNSTSCAPANVSATISSVEGASAPVLSSFQAVNCATLPFKPTLSASTQGNGKFNAQGASLIVKVASKGGPEQKAGEEEANIGKVVVQLPKALPSRLSTLQKACTEAQFAANPAGCPEASNVGTAVARTPVLPVPLEGPAYLVSHGGAAFPDLVLVLQGDGVTIDLTGNTQIKGGITYSRFESVPDAPISSFEVRLPEGQHSVLASNENLCAPTKTVTVNKRVTRRVRGKLEHVLTKVKQTVAEPLVMPTTITGQNGAVLKQSTKLAVTGCTKPKPKKQPKRPAKKASGARLSDKRGRR